MSYGLDNLDTGENLYLNSNWYTTYLKTAYKYGWKPMGTRFGYDLYNELENKSIEDLEQEWDGSYTCNNGQIILAEDALNISKALKKKADNLIKEDNLQGAENTLEVAEFFGKGDISIY